MRRYWPWGALLGVLLLAAAWVIARRPGLGEAAARSGADSVRIVALGPADLASARRADLVAGVPVSGTLEPAVRIRITAPLAEVLEEVRVKEGQVVRPRESLARFRTSVLGPAALSAEAQRRMAVSDHERMQALFREGAVAWRDVESAEVALRAAEAAEAQAKNRLAEATVRAPAGGVISRRAVDAGDRVQEGDPLFDLVNTEELEFEAAVPSEHAAAVRVGAPVILRVTGLLGATVAGQIARVNPTADPATRQITVYVTVPNRDGGLVGGLFASGRLVLQEVSNALAVPRAAVRTETDGGAFVWVVHRGRLARLPVTTGIADEEAGLVQIVSGLAGGERVVVGPAEGLLEGQPVQIVGGEG